MYWHGPLLAIAMASVITTSAGQSVHVAPAGDDANPGTADAPVQSLARLGEIIGERTDLSEVVLHEGVYRGWLPIKGPKDLSPEDLPHLLVRPAPGAEVTLDGAQPLEGAEPLDDAPGVYVVRDRMRYQSDGARKNGITPRMWDRVARLRYELVADVRAVAALEVSFAVTRDAIYVHPPDGVHPDHLHLELSDPEVGKFGISVVRPNVTVRGIHCRNYWTNPLVTAGILAYSPKVRIEECRVENCPRGYYLGNNDNEIVNCCATDVGGGVLVKGSRIRVEGCVLLKARDAFRVPMFHQENTGIEVYHPSSERVVVRGNVCQGFGHGVFVKCRPGVFEIEHNTLVGNTQGLGVSPGMKEGVLFRHNIVYGARRPVEERELPEKALTAEGNVFWPGPFRTGQLSRRPWPSTWRLVARATSSRTRASWLPRPATSGSWPTAPSSVLEAGRGPRLRVR